MAFRDYLTAEGERLLAKSIADSLPITFTRMVMGSGYLAQGTQEKNVAQVVTPVQTLDIQSITLNDSASTVITTHFINDGLKAGFYFREKAIYMQVGTEEVLAIYGYAGDTAEYIDTPEVCVVEKLIRTVLQLSADEIANVTLISGTSAAPPIVNNGISLEEFVVSKKASTIAAGQLLILSGTVYHFIGGDPQVMENYASGVDMSDVLSLMEECDEKISYLQTEQEQLSQNLGSLSKNVSTLQGNQEQTAQNFDTHKATTGNSSIAGHVKLSDSVSSSSGSSGGTAATPLAVKNAYDKATEAYSKAETAIDNAAEAIAKAEKAESIAKGKNQAHVFLTTESMQARLASEEVKGLWQVGDNLYIVDVGVPDWWISEVLDEPDADTGYYYKIAQLETQKVDLTEILSDIETLKNSINGIQLRVVDGKLQFRYDTEVYPNG